MTAQSEKPSLKEVGKDSEAPETDTTEIEVASAEGDYTRAETQKKIEEFGGEKAFTETLEKSRKTIGNEKNVIHALMMQALFHAYTYGNFRLATEVVYAYGEELGAESVTKMKQWFLAFGPFRWAINKNVKAPKVFQNAGGVGFAFRKSLSKEANIWNLRYAEANPFYSLARVVGMEEQEAEGTLTIDAYGKFTGFMNRARSLLDDVKEIRKEVKTKKDDQGAVIEVIGDDNATLKALSAFEKHLSSLFADETLLKAEKKKAA